MTIEEATNFDPGTEATEYETKQATKSAKESISSSIEAQRGTIQAVDCAFDTTENPNYYKPIESYEGYHRWDPAFEWTEEEEKAVVKKVGLYRGGTWRV